MGRYTLVSSTVALSRADIKARHIEECIARYTWYQETYPTIQAQHNTTVATPKTPMTTQQSTPEALYMTTLANIKRSKNKAYILDTTKSHSIHKPLNIKVDRKLKQVKVSGHGAFQLIDKAYPQGYTNPNITDAIVIETFGHKELQWLNNYYGDYMKNMPVTPKQSKKIKAKISELGLDKAAKIIITQESEISKRREVMFNTPKAYFISATKLTEEVYNRVLQLLKYGSSPYLYIENVDIYGLQLMSQCNAKSMLDIQYKDGQNFDPYVCASKPDSVGYKKLQELRAYQNDVSYQIALETAQDLYNLMKDKKNLNKKENIYGQECRNRYFDSIGKDLKVLTPKAKAQLAFKAQAYGIDLKLYETPVNTDKFRHPEHVLNSDILEDNNKTHKAMVGIHQKMKVAELASPDVDLAVAVETINWFESNLPGQFYLDKESTSRCSCGYPVNNNHKHCYICGTTNDTYCEETKSRDAQELDETIEYWNTKLATTLVTYKI